MTKYKTREEWLKAAANEYLWPMFETLKNNGEKKVRDALEKPLPINNTRYSCGWPKGASKAIGQCFSDTVSGDGTFEIFISPVLEKPLDVLNVLIHEMIHAAVGTECGHKGPFRTIAKALDLQGKMTATTLGDMIKERLGTVINELGLYPHAELTYSKAAGQKKKQTTRLKKAVCSECGYTVRVTKKWLEFGPPVCPMHIDNGGMNLID